MVEQTSCFAVLRGTPQTFVLSARSLLSNEALLVKLADILYNINDMPNKGQQIRMLKNVSAVLLERKDLTENTLRLAAMVFGN